jgi:hypothetical protein
LSNQVEELLRAYRNYQVLLADSPQSQDIEADEERKSLQSKARVAEDTFEAIFGDELKRFPIVLTTMPFELAMTTMISWISRVLPGQGGPENFRHIEAVSSRLRELSSKSEDGATDQSPRVYWPFIRDLRVYLKAYILSKGLIIADLPGLRDLNSARKAITERFVRRCDHVFVVANIDRATTNESIEKIFEMAQSLHLARVDVICTKSEVLELREAKTDWPMKRAAIEEMQQAIDADTHLVESLNEETDYLEQDVKDTADLNTEDARQLVNLQRARRKAEQRKETHEFHLKHLIINLRNRSVSDVLRLKYRGSKIFCIGNNLYHENRHKPEKIAMPYLQLSGILQLRRYCIGIVARSRLHATQDFIGDQIPAFLGSVMLWVEAGSGNASAEAKQQTLDAVSAIQREMHQVSDLKVTHTEHF